MIRSINVDALLEWMNRHELTEDGGIDINELEEHINKEVLCGGTCESCGRNADNGGFYETDNRTKCPIQEHYALLKDGFCHLYEPMAERKEP